MTHASVPPERRAAIGLTDSLVRISAGIEDPQDLIDDLAGAGASAVLMLNESESSIQPPVHFSIQHSAYFVDSPTHRR